MLVLYRYAIFIAESGNSHMVYVLPENVRIMSKKEDGNPKTISAGDAVIVSRTGKIKTSGIWPFTEPLASLK